MMRRLLLMSGALLLGMMAVGLPPSLAQDDPESTRTTLLQAYADINTYESMVIVEYVSDTFIVDAQTSTFTGQQYDGLDIDATITYVRDGGDGFPRVQLLASLLATRDTEVATIDVEMRAVGGVLYMQVLAADKADAIGETLPDGWLILTDDLGGVTDFYSLGAVVAGNSIISRLTYRFFSGDDLRNETLNTTIALSDSFELAPYETEDATYTGYALQFSPDDLETIFFPQAGTADLPLNRLYLENVNPNVTVLLDADGRFVGQDQLIAATFETDDLSVVPTLPAGTTGTITYTYFSDATRIITRINDALPLIEAPAVRD